MPVTSLIGAQWGSEGKGVFAAGMAHQFDAAVRVGGPNAGHSIWFDGDVFKMRSVPCSWVNPMCDLFIGAGAVLNADLLEAEAEAVQRVVYVDPLAVLITHEDEEAERAIVKAIGSTGEGVGQARIKRIRRDGTATLAGDHKWGSKLVIVKPTQAVLDSRLAYGERVFLEGTQGSGLSLYHGTQYPKATSEDTNEAGLYSATGISGHWRAHTQMVARTYPIRVAGDSGPMGEELSWDWFVEQGIVQKPEQTTVTKKVRRISHWYQPVYDRAVSINKPCGVWVSFGDYLAPELRGSRDWNAIMAHPALGEFLRQRMSETHVGLGRIPVLGVGMGPDADGDWVVAQPPIPFCRHGETWDLLSGKQYTVRHAEMTDGLNRKPAPMSV